MDIEIGKGKTARRAYGLDEIAIVPSRRTRARGHETSPGRWATCTWTCLASPARWTPPWTRAGGHHRVSRGLAVLNLEGLQTRYEDPVPSSRR